MHAQQRLTPQGVRAPFSVPLRPLKPLCAEPSPPPRPSLQMALARATCWAWAAWRPCFCCEGRAP
ncbi:hypothetical protein C8R44DRAFT_813616 [Mycena epipterygia]|nr:hypothetical protein C8R44DRAFT_813616 [Mycena epipterygia]